MNIFYVDEDPKLAAQALVDTHVVKMILESAQLLSTAHRVLDGKVTFHGMNRRLALPDPLLDATLYKEAYVNHPCAVWVRKSVGNYDWLLLHFTWLCGEYTYRFGRVHKCEELHPCLSALPRNLPIINVVLPVAQAMPCLLYTSDAADE